MDLMVAISRSPLTPPVSGVVDPPASTCLFSWDLTASISSCVVGGPLRRGFTELKKELIMFAISERMGDVAGALEPYTPGGDGPVLLPTVPGEVPGASLGGHNPGGHIPGGHIPALVTPTGVVGDLLELDG